jgi:DNA-binding NarL/FixJ family response regulator
MTAAVMSDGVRAAVLSDDQELAALVEALLVLNPQVQLHEPGLADPDVVVVDVGDGELTGLRMIREIRRALPAARLVAFSPLPDPVTFVAAVSAGADAYLSAGALWRELLPTIRAVCGIAEEPADAAT